MASYDWIKIDKPEDYKKLLGLLDDEFEPRCIVGKLMANITSRVKAVLVEHDYVDKDYRSTLYNFYAKKARPYRPDCVRIHFFDEQVDFENTLANETSERDLGAHYYGYVVLRPTLRATLGRSVLSPDIRVDARGRAIQGKHYVHLLGHRLSVWGFPSMDQHVDIAVCAHVACWAILRHYSENYSQYREYLVHDMARLATGFEPGGISPSRGLDEWEAERVFNAAGCFPVMVVRESVSNDHEFFDQLLAYLESGFPLYIGIGVGELGHAIVAAGYSWKALVETPLDATSHVWGQVDSLLTVDDNLLPYVSVPAGELAADADELDYTADNFESFIVALPEKIGYPADAMARYVPAAESLALSMGCDKESVRLHRYFMTTISGLRRYARNNASQLGETLVELFMRLDTAQFVWVLEFASVKQWAGGRVAARGIVDASASHRDPDPLWLLHNEEVAFVFDRSKAKPDVQMVELNRSSEAPLQRMEVNLRPVRS